MGSEMPPPGDEEKAEEMGDDSPGSPMAPPKEPCECSCLHCGRVFMSDRMWFQRVIGDPNGFAGFWMCPTANCGGAGFTFDIFPTDPDHPANEGWCYDDDAFEGEGEGDEKGEWDPLESKYQAFDDEDEDDDLEGEEWKHGLAPGDRPEPEWMVEARWQREEEERKYDEPDRRPREVKWEPREGGMGMGDFSQDDIPF